MSSIDASSSGDGVTTPLSMTSSTYPLATRSPLASNQTCIDGFQVTADNKAVIGVGDDGHVDDISTVYTSQRPENEIPLRYTAGHIVNSQTAANAIDESVKFTDNDDYYDKDAVTLSSFTITPCSSVTVNDTAHDSPPYPVAVPSSDLAPQDGSDSYAISKASSNTFPAQRHRTADETLADLQSAADMSALSCTVNALNLPLPPFQSTSLLPHSRRFSSPEAFSDVHNSREAVWQHEQAVRSDSDVEFLLNSNDACAGDVNRQQLHRGIAAEYSIDGITSSHHISSSAIASDINCKSMLMPAAVFASVDNNRHLCEGKDTVENYSHDGISLSTVVPVSKCECLPKSGISEATAVVNNKWSRDCSIGVENHPTDRSSSTCHLPTLSSATNSDVNVVGLSTYKQAAFGQHSVDDNVVTAKHHSVEGNNVRQGQMSDEAVNTCQPSVTGRTNVTHHLTALQQVSVIILCFSCSK